MTSPATNVVTERDEQLARLARALSHPARVAIVCHLATRGTCVCGEIVKILPLAQATVSQHEMFLAGGLTPQVRGQTL